MQGTLLPARQPATPACLPVFPTRPPEPPRCVGPQRGHQLCARLRGAVADFLRPAGADSKARALHDNHWCAIPHPSLAPRLAPAARKDIAGRCCGAWCASAAADEVPAPLRRAAQATTSATGPAAATDFRRPLTRVRCQPGTHRAAHLLVDVLGACRCSIARSTLQQMAAPRQAGFLVHLAMSTWR